MSGKEHYRKLLFLFLLVVSVREKVQQSCNALNRPETQQWIQASKRKQFWVANAKNVRTLYSACELRRKYACDNEI